MRFWVPNVDGEDDDEDNSRRMVEILHSDIVKHVVMETTGAQVLSDFPLAQHG